MVITICGSTRFKDKMMEVAEGLTLDGHIVLMPNVFHHDDENFPVEAKLQLDNLHREKINMSDAVFVVNIDKYIGESTYGELDWARRMKKEIYFLEPMEEPKDEEAPAPGEDAIDA